MDTVLVKNDDGMYIGQLFYANVELDGNGYEVNLSDSYKLSGEDFQIYFESINLHNCTKIKTVDMKMLEVMKSFLM